MFNEITKSIEKIYNGKIIDLERITVELHNGKSANRDVIRHSGAACILPIDDEGNIYVVSQYRKPIEKFSMEIPAGKIDEGETPMQCALRELSEETGLRTNNIKFMFKMATTPAFCDEIIHFFVATELTQGDMHTDEDEFIKCEKVHIDKLYQMICEGEIIDSKTITAVLVAKLMRSGKAIEL